MSLACPGFSGSTATVMTEPPGWPSAGPSQPIPGSPTTFAPYKDDILTVTEMIDSHNAHSQLMAVRIRETWNEKVEDEEKKIQNVMMMGLGTGAGKIFPYFVQDRWYWPSI
ncbi:hypothetical protein EDC04DRAFT_3090102 [Pisolithus marmoratus]|nr:hypothetical protein EDC04DRAFT_3090102 [Pisolithus marmoratus]